MKSISHSVDIIILAMTEMVVLKLLVENQIEGRQGIAGKSAEKIIVRILGQK